MVWNGSWSKAGGPAGPASPADAPDAANSVDPSVGQKVRFCKMYSMCATSANLRDVWAMIFERCADPFKMQVCQPVSFEA